MKIIGAENQKFKKRLHPKMPIFKKYLRLKKLDVSPQRLYSITHFTGLLWRHYITYNNLK